MRVTKFSASLVLWAVVATALSSPVPADAAPLVPNGQFSAGDQTPTGWRLSGGKGRWVDRKCVEVSGAGKDANHWACDCTFQPGGLYRFRMHARAVAGGGCVTSGPSGANHDWQLKPDWEWKEYVFRVPDNVTKDAVRVGQWEAHGTFQFDRVQLLHALPVYRAFGPLKLGEGESFRDGQYTFSGTFGGAGGNFHRPLLSATAGFNSDRWCIGGDQQVTYRFALPDKPFRTGRISFDVSYHSRGSCLAEVSRDGQTWRTLATLDKVGTAEALLPTDMLPADVVLLRLRGDGKASSFQVHRVEFQAQIDDVRTLIGRTLVAGAEELSPDLIVDGMVLDDTSGAPQIRIDAHQAGTGEATAELSGWGIVPGRDRNGLGKVSLSLHGRQPGTFAFTLPAAKPGRIEALLTLASPGLAPLVLQLPIDVPDFYRADYGRQVAGLTGPTAVWWCDATHKIARQRPAPTETAPAAQMSAARNDHEAVQIVVRPTAALKGLAATAGPLHGPGGATIPAANVQVLRVVYHFVQHPTDATGLIDWWPDALPPLDKPLDVPAGLNQPLWVLVYVPSDARAGEYAGTLDLRAEGFAAQVPLQLHVWNFALPERNHLETALGLDVHTVFRYQQLKSEEDKRRVLDMYFASFAAHRISPYDPVPLDPIGVKLRPDADPPHAELDFARYDAAMSRAFARYHFTNFMLPLQGMGGGTFHARSEPSIGKYGEDTPQYQATFADNVKQLQTHLRDKGWLDRAYTYWFDEPDKKDYAFVRTGMERIKRYAPGLTTMITKQPSEGLAGPIDIWCPVTPSFEPAAADARRDRGERFWWYVCCGPKAPWCTLFIDHPATELRVWLWQTWQHRVSGILIWGTNYWHSPTAFPHTVQNPYLDPMGYVSGYGVPAGSKQYWGNGDGRFLYPPEAAAVPGASGPGPVLEPPVSSIRWEMLREGIEDYEYLCRLRELVDKLPAGQRDQYAPLLEVPEAITRTMTAFTADPAPIYQRRQQIAAAIEKLSAQQPRLDNPFFAFDNGTGRGTLAPEAQAQMLKELGYAGIGYTGTQNLAAMLKALDDRGLKMFSTYVALRLDGDQPGYDPGLKQAIEQFRGRDTALWLTVQGRGPATPEKDALALKHLGEIAEFAAAAKLRVVLYPHYGFYVATVQDALRLADKLDRPNVGISLNLCHWLRSGDEPNLQLRLKQALPRLMLVSINGADHTGDWDRLIQTLDRGEYDVYTFLKTLRAAGYSGPIGLQCYNVKGDMRENLVRSIAAWRRFVAKSSAE